MLYCTVQTFEFYNVLHLQRKIPRFIYHFICIKMTTNPCACARRRQRFIFANGLSSRARVRLVIFVGLLCSLMQTVGWALFHGLSFWHLLLCQLLYDAVNSVKYGKVVPGRFCYNGSMCARVARQVIIYLCSGVI